MTCEQFSEKTDANALSWKFKNNTLRLYPETCFPRQHLNSSLWLRWGGVGCGGERALGALASLRLGPRPVGHRDLGCLEDLKRRTPKSRETSIFTSVSHVNSQFVALQLVSGFCSRGASLQVAEHFCVLGHGRDARL